MAETIKATPNSVYYRYTSGKWTNVQKLWDGDVTTCPDATKQSGAVILEFDLSALPPGAVVTKITAHNYYKRRGNEISPLVIGGSDRDTYSTQGRTVIGNIPLPNGTYDKAEWHIGDLTLTREQSDALLALKHKTITIPNPAANSSVHYELYLMVTYVLPASQIWVGDKNATAVYVGDVKATAVYIGDKKIL